MDSDSEDTSSASCRIVVVSSSLDTAREVANRIKALSGDTSEGNPSEEVVHWTIRNKYYTAPVHFHPIHLEGLESIELDDVPAIIYAWKENEPYKEHMKQVVEHTSTYEPEVSLAIGMSPTTDEELEDFFFEHGFEYIDGHSQVGAKSASLTDASLTPGITRALDALSTIMWPSMVRAESKGTRLDAQATSYMALEGVDETDIDLHTLVNAAGGDGQSNMQREVEMLEKWLEEEDDKQLKPKPFDSDDNDYASLYSHAQSISTVKSDDPWSTGTVQRSGSELYDREGEGFDDDFTEFVSASSSNQPGRSTTDEESDTDLPSPAEIRAASTQIFGPSLSRLSSGAFTMLPDSPSPANDGSVPHGSESELPSSSTTNAAEVDIDAPTFDLTHIIGVLEGMKEEISRIPDEKERRRAAARAALGLIYGMDKANEELDVAERVG